MSAATGTGPKLIGPHKLTEKQAAVFRFIAEFFGEHLRSPTIREIAAAFNIDSPNGIVCHLRPLEKKGVVRLNEGKGTRGLSRCIEIVGIEWAVRTAVQQRLREVIG